MSPTPSSSSPTTPEPLLDSAGAAGAAGGTVSPEPTGNGPAVNPETGIAPAGQPLTHLGGSMEYLENHESSSEPTEEAGSRATGRRVLRRRALNHEEYHALVQDRMRDLDALEAAGGARLAPGHGLVVALDVDGTILDMDGHVSERVMASVARLRAHEVPVVISTGRGIAAAMPVVRHLGLSTGWMVCANGALTLRLDPDAPGGYEVVDSRTFDPRTAIETLHAAVPAGILAVEDPGAGFKVSRLFPDGELIEDQRVVTFDELVSQPVTRVVLRAPGMPVDRFSQIVADSGLHSVEYAIGWTAWLDVAPEGVTKASALEALVARLGTDSAHVLAVGDGSNDVEMIEWAGAGVVMGSAPQWVRDRGDILTEPVWRDGCAAVLDALIERVRHP